MQEKQYINKFQNILKRIKYIYIIIKKSFGFPFSNNKDFDDSFVFKFVEFFFFYVHTFLANP